MYSGTAAELGLNMALAEDAEEEEDAEEDAEADAGVAGVAGV